MKPADIQFLLKKNKVTQSDIARRTGVAPVTVSNVITGSTTSRRVAQAIAEATGLSIQALWPGKYPDKDDS